MVVLCLIAKVTLNGLDRMLIGHATAIVASQDDGGCRHGKSPKTTAPLLGYGRLGCQRLPGLWRHRTEVSGQQRHHQGLTSYVARPKSTWERHLSSVATAVGGRGTGYLSP